HPTHRVQRQFPRSGVQRHNLGRRLNISWPVLPVAGSHCNTRDASQHEALRRHSSGDNLAHATILPMNALLPLGSALAATAGAIVYGAVNPRAQLFGGTVCRTNSPGKLAITFDDGPNPSLTLKLLDLLAKHNARATFFVIGRYVTQCPDIVRET